MRRFRKSGPFGLKLIIFFRAFFFDFLFSKLIFPTPPPTTTLARKRNPELTLSGLKWAKLTLPRNVTLSGLIWAPEYFFEAVFLD